MLIKLGLFKDLLVFVQISSSATNSVNVFSVLLGRHGTTDGQTRKHSLSLQKGGGLKHEASLFRLLRACVMLFERGGSCITTPPTDSSSFLPFSIFDFRDDETFPGENSRFSLSETISITLPLTNTRRRPRIHT